MRAWLSATCQKRPSHWLALRLASASRALSSLPVGPASPPPQTPTGWRKALSDLCGPLHTAEQSSAAAAAWQAARGLHAWAQAHRGAAPLRPGGPNACHTALVETLFQSYAWASRSSYEAAGSQSSDPAACAAAAASLQLHVAVLSHLATLLAAAVASSGMTADSTASALQPAVIACCRAQFERSCYQKRDSRPQV